MYIKKTQIGLLLIDFFNFIYKKKNSLAQLVKLMVRNSLKSSLESKVYNKIFISNSSMYQMVLAILGSYAVQFYVPMEIIWPSLSTHFHTSRSKLIAEYTFRTLLVLVTCKFSKLQSFSFFF